VSFLLITLLALYKQIFSVSFLLIIVATPYGHIFKDKYTQSAKKRQIIKHHKWYCLTVRLV